MKKQRLPILLATVMAALLLIATPASAVFAAAQSDAAMHETSSVPLAPASDSPPASSQPPETGEDLMEDQTVALRAPQGLRAGATVTFTFWAKGENVRALQGTIAYDPEVLTYVKGEGVSDSWMLRFSPEDGKLQYLGVYGGNEGTSGESEIFSVTFTIASDAETGTSIPFTLSEAIVYNGERELSYKGCDYTFAVERPLSTQCTLTALSVEGGNLSPAFSPDVLVYTLTLPYTVQQANITAQPCELARVEIGNCTLAVGENDVTVTVISESGLQKVYTVKITRAADPYYIPSADNRILSMTLSKGLLFPAFSPEVLEYSVYIVKGQEVTLTPIPADKATVDALTIPGDASDDADYTIVCSAENGTTRVYTFHTILLNTPEELAAVEAQNAKKETVDHLTIGILAFAGITVFFLGFVLSYILFGVRRKKNQKKTSDAAEDSPSLVAPEVVPAVLPSPETPDEANLPSQEGNAPDDASSKTSSEDAASSSDASRDASHTASRAPEHKKSGGKKKKQKGKKKHH